MKYWLLALKSPSPTEEPLCIGIYLSKQDADEALDVELECFPENQTDDYEIVTIIVPLSSKR